MPQTKINCKTCGLEIAAVRSGKTTIWTESNGRKHQCAGTGSALPITSNIAAPKVLKANATNSEAVMEAFDINEAYKQLEELEKAAELEKLAAEEAAREAREEAEAVEAAKKSLAQYEPTPDGTIPVLDGDYLIDSVQLDAIRRVIKLAELGRPQNIGLHGPAGSGKTTLGVQIGALRGSKTFIVEAAAKQTADEWYGEAVGVNKETGAVQFRESHFVTGVETENAVVVINDVALLQSRTVQNGLNELLDPSTRSTFVEQLGRRVQVAKGVIIVGTWNVGSEYTGASELSAQILDRFRSGALFELPYPDNGALAHILTARSGLPKSKAEKLASLADWMTADAMPIPVSTRGLIAAANHIVQGARIGEAIAFTVFGELDVAERQRAYGIIVAKVPAKERPEWDIPQRGKYVRLS